MHQPATDHGIQPLVTRAATSVGTAESPPPSTPTDSTGVQPQVQYEVPPGPETKALVKFLTAHTMSVVRKRVTRQLKEVAMPAELARQRQVIRFAALHDYTVPLHPVALIVSISRDDARQRHIGVCLWLPSTEYVDARTGRPASGQVPQSWAPAIASLHRLTVTWKVGSLSPARDYHQISCGGSP